MKPNKNQRQLNLVVFKDTRTWSVYGRNKASRETSYYWSSYTSLSRLSPLKAKFKQRLVANGSWAADYCDHVSSTEKFSLVPLEYLT